MASLRLNPGQTACPKGCNYKRVGSHLALFCTKITDEVQPEVCPRFKYTSPRFQCNRSVLKSRTSIENIRVPIRDLSAARQLRREGREAGGFISAVTRLELPGNHFSLSDDRGRNGW